MAITVTPIRRAPWTTTYQFKVDNGEIEGTPVALPAGINSLVLGPVNTESVPDPLTTRVIPLAAAACFASFDPSPLTFKKDPTDATQILIDVYVSDGVTLLIIDLCC